MLQLLYRTMAFAVFTIIALYLLCVSLVDNDYSTICNLVPRLPPPIGNEPGAEVMHKCWCMQ